MYIRRMTLTDRIIYLSKEVIELYIQYGTIKRVNGKLISIEGDEIRQEEENENQRK